VSEQDENADIGVLIPVENTPEMARAYAEDLADRRATCKNI
jgi:hypothetical protein